MNSLTLIHPSSVKTIEELRAFARGVNDLRSMGLSGRTLLSTFGIFTWDDYRAGIEKCQKAGIPIDDTETFPSGKERILEVEVGYCPAHGHGQWLVVESMKFKALHRTLVTTMYKHFGHEKLDNFLRDRLLTRMQAASIVSCSIVVIVHILEDGSYDVIRITYPDAPTD